MKSKFLSLVTFSCLCCSPTAWAEISSGETSVLRQQVEQLTAAVQQLVSTVQTQQQRIADLEGAPSQTKFRTDTTAGSASRQSSGGANLSAFNPEIGVVGDLVAQTSESSADGEGNDKLSVRELELVFGHPIDPYSRFDSTITFSDFETAPSVEEAYITHWGLPGEIKTRLGRLKPKIGKAIPIHRDSLDTVDEPLVIQKYFGAEGLARTGVDVSGFLPVPWSAVTHEVTAGILEGGVGEGGTLFGGTRRQPSFYAHMKNFWDVSDETNAEFGVTYLSGSKDADRSHEVQAVGLDATLVHYVTPNNKLKWQSEAYLQDRDEAFEEATLFSDNPWGWYSLLDYRLSPRFGVGGRFDYVELVDTNPALLARDGDTAWSGYLTLYQSEFARWRLQYRHTEFALGGNDNTVFLQGTVAIGVHKHQLQ